MAVVRVLRAPVLRTHLAVPDRHQRLPDTAAAQRARRPLPSGLAGPGNDLDVPDAPHRTGTDWVQPFPTAPAQADLRDPASAVESRETLRLAFVAALQLLPPRQRAVLVLRDVLAWRAAEVADLLGISTAAVKSVLQRARARLASRPPLESEVGEPSELRLRNLLDAYVSAFETADVSKLVQLLREDARFGMPPFPMWFRGRDAVAGFVGSRVLADPGGLRLLPTRANGQPAVAAYRRGTDGVHWAHAVHVLTVDDMLITRIVAFSTPACSVTSVCPSSVRPVVGTESKIFRRIPGCSDAASREYEVLGDGRCRSGSKQLGGGVPPRPGLASCAVRRRRNRRCGGSSSAPPRLRNFRARGRKFLCGKC
ncbi:RNA polymerase subunit sigma-70 [Streptomyces synnematoformans]|uniref:Uncharacterized protein n=1 Tax=Streptomyces synnematoformans TaxID=415721 RepID=A0ABN2Y8I4_9ACTN